MNKVATDHQHIKLSYITHFYCNQNDISSVVELLRKYEKYAKETLDVLQFIIVDDGSPIEYNIPDFNLNLTWLKIKEDIPWNQAGARNLGVTYAKSDKIIISDLDHEFPEETLNYMIKHRSPGRNFYKLYRRNDDGSIKKGHSNIFFMSRARFFRHFGYDEEFSGHYGAEDYRFVKYHKSHGSRQGYLPKNIICKEREINREKSYHSLVRDLGYNTPVDQKKKNEIDKYGAESGHSRMFLNFTWSIGKVFYRPKPALALSPYWRKLWWFRYLFERLSR